MEKLVQLSFRGYFGEIESGEKNLRNVKIYFCIGNAVSGSALQIFKSQLVKAVAVELSETLSVFWLAQLVPIPFLFFHHHVNCSCAGQAVVTQALSHLPPGTFLPFYRAEG